MSLAAAFFNVGDSSFRSNSALRLPARVAARRELYLAGAMVLAIALIDLFFQNNYSLLYIAPIIALAPRRDLSAMRPITLVIVVLIYAMFFLKNTLFPQDGFGYLDFRLINRTFTALLMVALSKMLQMWIVWRDEQSDPEMPEAVRFQDAEISSTFALLCCLPAVGLLAAIDFFAPAHINVAILYPVPLFICGWTRSRRLVWSMLVLLTMLTLVAFVLGPPTWVVNRDYGLERHRLLAVMAMLAVTFTLHFWLGPADGRNEPRSG